MSGAALQGTLKVPPPFELRVALFGHGWIDLAPHQWDEETQTWTYPFESARGLRTLQVRPAARGLRWSLRGRGALGPHDRAVARSTLRRCLGLEQDFGDFWSRCAQPGAPNCPLGWVAERGAGRLLRSATPFEDLLKILLTTNCTWGNTRSMVQRLVENFGGRTPGGHRAFPSAKRCARITAKEWKEVVKVGYRVPGAMALSAAARRGELDADRLRHLDTAALEAELSALPGFGPYAVGLSLRLLGRYEALALDSWCRARARELWPNMQGKAPSDKELHQRFAPYEQWAGLALWMALTAQWHGEAKEPEA